MKHSWAFAALVFITSLSLLLLLRAPTTAPTPPAPAEAPSPARPAVATEAHAAVHVTALTTHSEPVIQASILLHDGDRTEVIASAVSDARGHATLRAPFPGEYAITVIHPEFAPEERRVQLGAGRHQISIQLERGARVQGRVQDAQSRPIPNVTVRVLEVGSDQEHGHTRSGADGQFTIGGLPLGTFRLYVHSGRHRPRYTPAMKLSAHGETREVTVSLEAGRSVSGRVLDEAGQPVGNARVGCSDEGCNFVVTGEDGQFELGGLGDEPVNVFAVAKGFAPMHAERVRPGTRGLDLVGAPPASLRVPLLGGVRASTLELKVCRSEVEPELCVAAQRYDGPPEAAELRDLPAGKFVLLLEQPGKRPFRMAVELEPGQRTTTPPVHLGGTAPRLAVRAAP